MDIKYLINRDIDKGKWDACIERSQNALVYAKSWYLDYTAEHWDALIVGDYLFVMPVIWKKKYGLKYMYNPTFLQQSGIFSAQKIEFSHINQCLDILNKKFAKVVVHFNYMNSVSEHPDFEVRDNYILKLNKSYDELYADFNSKTKYDIRKALKSNTCISDELSIGEFIDFKKQNLKNNLTEQNFTSLTNLLNYYKSNKLLESYSVRNENNQIIAAALFIKENGRAYYLQAAANAEGRRKSAAFMLLNHFIKTHAGTDLILDFEGSMIPGVARFFKRWGAEKVQYFRYEKTNSKFLKVLKK